MKCVSAKQPPKYDLRRNGSDCLIIFADNIQVHTITPDEESEPEKEYSYERYELTVPFRDTLERDVSANPDEWLNMAKEQWYNKLDHEARKKRAELLIEADGEATIDRIIQKYGIADIDEIPSLPISIYKQALRDIPQQPGYPENISWPTKPF